MKVSLSIGPGQYADRIAGELRVRHMLGQVFRSSPYPQAKKYAANGTFVERRYGSLELFQRSAWGVWTRLPHLKKYRTPMGYIYPMADRFFARDLEPCDVFVGWTMVSLETMRRANELGARTILENQMSGITHWIKTMKEEYKRWRHMVDGYHSLFPERLVSRIKREYAAADTINVLSSYAKRTFEAEDIDPAKITVTPFGIDTDLFSPGPDRKPEDGKFRILYVGRIQLLKGVQYLLEAFKNLKGSGLELVLAGEVVPEFRGILALYEDERIKIIGPVPNSELPDLYRSSDVFVFPSLNDAFGLVVGEAMSCGVPAIITENTCGYDVVEHGVDGYVIPCRDPIALSTCLSALRDNGQLCSTLGNMARKKIINRFSLSKYLSNYKQLFV